MPRPRLDPAVKADRGTLRPSRERARANGGVGPSPTPDRVLDGSGEARDYVAIATTYMHDVIAGGVVAGQWVRLTCERQERDSHRACSDPGWPYTFDPERAADACSFVERLPHIEGRWQTPTIRLEPWQIFVLCALFGWRHRADPSRRRFTTLYLEVARKSAKSTLSAAIALYHLLREDEPGASVICGATTGAQARICFGIMQRLVRRSAWLRDEGLQVFANAIVHDDSGGTARPVNSKASSLDGLNPSCIVLDESHAQNFSLHDVLKSAQGSRQNPLILAPTTAGYDLLSVGYALRTTVTKVLESIFENDSILGLIFTLDDGDDWRDPGAWPKANPMLGVSPTLEWVTQYATDAQQTPGLKGEFRTKVCSQWLQSSLSWLSMTAWDACADPTLRLEDFAGEPCYIGGDLAQLDDLAALAFVFKRDDVLYGFVRCYLPAHVVDARARKVPAYRQWADSGLLILTEGDMIDYGRIEVDVRDYCEQFDVREIVFDQFGSVQIVGNLSNDGFPARVEAKSTKTFTSPSRELETRVTHRKFRHDGNDCLRWMASNCVVSRRTDDSLLVKKQSAESADKIDGVDALIQAIGALLAQPAPVELFVDGLQFV